MEIKTINSSKLNWEIFPQNPETTGSDGLVNEYCADGDGFVVVLENERGEFFLVDQGDDVANLGNDRQEALERAQNYLAATYNEIFKSFSF